MTSAAPKILLIGAGNMAVAYAHVLRSLGVTPVVLGRGRDSALAFEQATGIAPLTGDLSERLAAFSSPPQTAIVTVNARFLAAVTIQLIDAGVKRLLVEKPAAIDLAEMSDLVAAARRAGAEVYVAYNRRFLSSVLRAWEIIGDDGGVISVKFDFSEPSRRIAQLGKPQRELDTWFYGNSTHVLDLAFHFSGQPRDLRAEVKTGGVPFYAGAGLFVGHGRAVGGAHLSWHASWVAPGRWGVEVMTAEHRLIFQPLEKLRIQDQSGFAETEVELDDPDDREFKPGLVKQLRAFLYGEKSGSLQTLAAHADNMRFYEVIRTGGTYQNGPNETNG